MQSALNENLCASQLYSLLNFLEEITSLQKICFRVVFISPEGAKPASVYTDIRVVDIPVHNKSYYAVRMQTFSHLISHPTELEQISFFEQSLAFFFRNPFFFFFFL